MPLFNESLESIAQAIVTVKRALKAGVLVKKEYKELNAYLAKRAKDFKIKKTHLVQANKDLDEELLDEELEFYTEEGDALYKMAEELLEEFDEKPAAEAVEDDWDKQAAACAAWMKMDDKERAAMAVLASNWQKSR
jgi:multidrug efflux pump subunit AcrB